MEVLNYTNPLNLSTALLMFIIGVFGITCNFSIIYVFIKEKSERTAFNLICFVRAISNITILSTVFLGLFFPKTLLGYSLYPPAVESWMIHLNLSLYLGNEYQVILVALNRLCALFFPTYYSNICGILPTLIILIAIYLYRFLAVILEMIPQTADECYTSFSLDLLSWINDPDPGCTVDDNIVEVILYTFIAMTCINVVTFLKVIVFYWAPNKTMHRETKNRIEKNTRLFFQTMLQDSLYLIDLTFTFKLSGLSTHRIWTFVSGTLVWECLHSIDGFIMLVFNERLSNRFQATKLHRRSTVSVILNPTIKRDRRLI